MHPRRRLSALAVSVLLALSALPLFAGAVAATNVATEAELVAAWGNPAETLITLTANVAFFCDGVGDTPAVRNSTTAIVVDGGGIYTISNPAPCTTDALEQDGTGLVTLRNLTLTGNPAFVDGLNTVGNVVVENSSITGHGDDAVDTDGDATVTNSSLSNNSDRGLDVGNLGDATVSGSTLNGNGDDAIRAEGNVTLTSSTVSENGERGVNSEADVAVSGVSTISGNGQHGIDADGNVTVSGSTISANAQDGIVAGGALIGGDVTVSASTISGNGVDFGCGNGITADGAVSVTGPSSISDNADAGIVAEGVITVTGSTVSGNLGTECDEDGIRSDGVAVTVTDSIVSENDGNGIESEGAATVTGSTVSDNFEHGIRAFDAVVSSSTISGNGDQGNGSGVVADNDATVTDSTITANEESGVDAIFGDARVTNSTVTDHVDLGVHALAEVFATNATITGNGVNVSNQNLTTIHLFGTVLLDAVDVNCIGVVADDGFNFIDDASCVGILPNLVPPQLGALAANGGPTQTRLPADTSPLLDVIPGAQCRVTTDQRGIARPQGGGCDIGAVEVVPPAASITDVTVTEGNAGFVNAVFTVTLSRTTTRTVTMSFATANGSATAPADYEAASGTLTFVPGDVSETITVRVAGDTVDEPNEAFVVNLTAPVGASIADAQGTGTILDDDAPAAAALPDTGTAGTPLNGLGAPDVAIGVLVISAAALIRNRRRQTVRTR